MAEKDFSDFEKLLLREIKSIAGIQERTNDELVVLAGKINKLEASIERLSEVERWVGKMKEIATARQYERQFEDTRALLSFKDRVVWSLVIVQAIGALVMYLSKFI